MASVCSRLTQQDAVPTLMLTLLQPESRFSRMLADTSNGAILKQQARYAAV
jgi:hypothetical protein